jgi:hypothetical protein
MKNHPLRTAMLFRKRVFVWVIIGCTGATAVLFVVGAPYILLLWLTICVVSFVVSLILFIGTIMPNVMTRRIKKAMSSTNPIKIFAKKL